MENFRFVMDDFPAAQKSRIEKHCCLVVELYYCFENQSIDDNNA